MTPEERFRSADRMDAPDLWPAITSRATQGPAPEPDRHRVQRWLVAAAATTVVLFVVLGLLFAAFRPFGRPVTPIAPSTPSATDPCALFDTADINLRLHTVVTDVRQLGREDFKAPHLVPADYQACSYDTGPHLGQLIVATQPMTSQEFDRRFVTPGAGDIIERVNGVGERAVFDGCGQLAVFDNGLALTLGVQYADCDVIDGLRSLAILALNRLGATDGWRTYSDPAGWNASYPADWLAQQALGSKGSAVITNDDSLGRNRQSWDLSTAGRAAVIIEVHDLGRAPAPVPGGTALPLHPDLVDRPSGANREHYLNHETWVFRNAGSNFMVHEWVGVDASDQDVRDAQTIVESIGFPGASLPPGEVREQGITVTLPRGWRLARKTLTPNLGDPHEVLSAGTFDLPPNHGATCAQYPVTATEEMGTRDAFVTIGERSMGQFPKDTRPNRFVLPDRSSNDEWPQCMTKSKDFFHWVTVFEENGREIYLYVAMGTDASPDIKQQVTDFLNSVVVGENTGWPMWPGRTSDPSLGISFQYPVGCCRVHWVGDPTFEYGQELAQWTSERHEAPRCPRPGPGEFVVLLSEYTQIPGEPLYADGYAPRPDHFHLPPPRPASVREGCDAQPDSLIKFTEAGRYLYIHVLWGEDAYDRHAMMVAALLDSLVISEPRAPAPCPIGRVDVTLRPVRSVELSGGVAMELHMINHGANCTYEGPVRLNIWQDGGPISVKGLPWQQHVDLTLDPGDNFVGRWYLYRWCGHAPSKLTFTTGTDLGVEKLAVDPPIPCPVIDRPYVEWSPPGERSVSPPG